VARAFKRRPLRRQQSAIGETKFAHQVTGAMPNSSSCGTIFLRSIVQSPR
jgi:hypothetical protein